MEIKEFECCYIWRFSCWLINDAASMDSVGRSDDRMAGELTVVWREVVVA
jgi:hypothetical protein